MQSGSTMQGFEVEGSASMEVNGDVKMEEESGKKKEKVSFFGLFSAADKIDCVLMLIGSLGAIIHGAALPVFFILFGRMIDSLGHFSSNPHELSSKISEVRCLYSTSSVMSQSRNLITAVVNALSLSMLFICYILELLCWLLLG